jgi:hypothetical protein
LILLSASQLQLYKDCPRKWGFRYLDGIVTPPHPAALLGTEVQDEQIDPYLLTGRGFDFTRPSGEIANKLAPLLPKPIPTGESPGLLLRRKFVNMPSPTGRFAYRGEFDLWAPDSRIVPGLALDLASLGRRPAVLLGDIKTTGNLKYAKTAEALTTDIQAQLYAAATMFEDNVDELDAVWFYTRTKGAHKVLRSYVRLEGSRVADEFGRIDALGDQLATIKRAHPKAETLKPNPRMCDEYRGCPYRSICNLSPAVHAAAINHEEIVRNMGTADFLTQLRKNVGAPAAPPAVTSVVPSTPNPMASLLPAWATAPVDPMPARHGALINPPEAALPPAPPVGVVVVASEAPTEPATPGAKRTRRTKAEMEVARRAQNPDEYQPADKSLEESKLEGVTVAEATQVGPVPTSEVWVGIAKMMKQAGVKRLAFMSGQVHEIELFRDTPAQ